MGPASEDDKDSEQEDDDARASDAVEPKGDAAKAAPTSEPPAAEPRPVKTRATPPPPPVDDVDPVPLSTRDLELEPVSLVEIEQILAPGKTPPKLGAKLVPSVKLGRSRESEPAPNSERGRRSDRARARASEDLNSDSATIDLRALAAAAAPPKKKIDEDLANLTSVPPPAPLDLTTLPDLNALAKRKKTPKPPAVKQVAYEDDAEPAPRSARAAAASEPRASTRSPAAATTARPPAPLPQEAPKSNTFMMVLAAVGLLSIGFFIGRMTAAPSSTPSPPSAAAPLQGQPAPTQPTTTVTTGASQPPGPLSGATEPPPVDPTASAATANTAATTTATATTTNALTGPILTGTTPTTAATTATAAATETATAATGAEFDKAAANAALSSAVGTASGCKKEGDPSGKALVSITFAPSGKVTRSTISGPPFQGTPTGSCIALAFKSASVPPFSGDPMTVTKTVTIP